MKLLNVIVAVVITSGILTGCSKEPSSENSITDTGVKPNTTASSQGGDGIQVGIGDAEAQFWWALLLHPESLSPSIIYEEFETKRETIAKVDMIVNEPFPESIVIQSSSRHLRSFEGHAIRVDLNILMDEKSILTYSYITGAQAQTEWHQNEVDIMRHLKGIEENVLIRGEAQLTMFKNVDESTITLDTPLDGPNVYTTKKLSNTVRVKFN